jgi:hypothetical protein
MMIFLKIFSNMNYDVLDRSKKYELKFNFYMEK